MKIFVTRIFMILMLALAAVEARAEDNQTPLTLAVLGASFENECAPFNYPLWQLGMANPQIWSYWDFIYEDNEVCLKDTVSKGLGTALEELYEHAPQYEYWEVQNYAEAGAVTRNVANPDGSIAWLGIVGTIENENGEKINQWLLALGDEETPDDDPDAVYIGLWNDCLHGYAGVSDITEPALPCEASDYLKVAGAVYAVSLDALTRGILVLISKYPDPDSFDMATAQETYGFPWTVETAELERVATTFNKLCEMAAEHFPNVACVDSWREFQATDDGMHPTPESSKAAAKQVAKALDRLLLNSLSDFWIE